MMVVKSPRLVQSYARSSNACARCTQSKEWLPATPNAGTGELSNDATPPVTIWSAEIAPAVVGAKSEIAHPRAMVAPIARL